jgi:membrane associated rhomboid family serine protease
MGGLIPLSDASRRPARIPVVTVFIILVNTFVFVLELMKGESFVTQWSAVQRSPRKLFPATTGSRF